MMQVQKFSFFKRNKFFVFIVCVLMIISVSTFHYIYNFKDLQSISNNFLHQNRLAFESADEFELFRKLDSFINKRVFSIDLYIKDRAISLGERSSKKSVFDFTYNIENKSNTVVVTFFSRPNYFATLYFSTFLFLLIGVFFIITYYDKKIREQQNQANLNLFNMSQKLAHDIRSPISTLNLISSKIDNDDIKFLQLAVVDQINAIANDLLKQSKISQNEIDLKQFWDNLIREYSLKKNAIPQEIIFQSKTDLSARISVYLSNLLYRTINNFIQNSIEATPNDGKISIFIQKNINMNIEILIADTGKGMPAHILEKIGKVKISYGKENENNYNSGSGIAMYNAARDLADHGCLLSVKSYEGLGTEVIITLLQPT